MTDRPPAKRKWPRLHHELMVTLATERHGSFSGWSTSVSQGGCFVNTNIAAPVGDVADETTRARLGRIVSQLSKDLSTAPA